MAFRGIGQGNISLADFRSQNLVFVDKTPYVQKFEELKSGAVVFLRPRRFGKTLFTNILQSYYDKSLASRFDDSFSGTWIHDHRTPLAIRTHTSDPVPFLIYDSRHERTPDERRQFNERAALAAGNHIEDGFTLADYFFER